ncbi:glycine/betaine ABC transporter [Shouchella plakortidis]|uniref:Glycine/betaine ABC transporter n=2 Tax=Alkalicoccobacillus plakortidis TaxID=444060 RepID=A0ABT0XHI0_9BACI|nr:glycine betaine ABC transporter substrate-binding protein [Alkalicoccobacillus plakortidis]MCM2675381.1 glycine/betaine ABC transporter [Alkalicoccobacillus plakortidis]
MKMNTKKLGLAIGLTSILALAACGDSNDGADSGDDSSGADASSLSEITGIDGGAGVMTAAQNAIDTYGLDLALQASSGAAMTEALGNAINNEDPIVVTGWTPHWMFATYDLKYLDDPEGVFGEEESIHTFTREGLAEDAPEANTVLDNFHWTEDEMGEVMLDIQEGTDPEEAAANWVESNQDRVDEWTNGVDQVDGETISLAYVSWDSEIASTNVVKTVLESVGYTVETASMESAFMWTAIAEGEQDAMVAGWLPLTHEAYYEDYKDQVVDLGPNFEGAKTGLVVPAYMDIDSIEDLK